MNFDPINLLFIPMIAVVYFLMIRPKQKEQQAMAKMLGSLKRGDRVLTHSGMYGEVAALKDDVITLKFSDNVRIDFNKSAIQKTVDEKAEAKA
jgi:preprotein translocase subunit YajC